MEQTRDAARRRRRKAEERSRHLNKRRADARSHAEQLAKEIGYRDTSVRKIWGFGSVFDLRLPFRESSDIDLAVEGGTILAWKLSRNSMWEVDWVELCEQPESMVRSITETGVLLYERK